jgi:DNA-binding PadR family transcriptional regulator
MTKWGENLNLRLSKNGKIGIEKYLKLRNEYSQKIEELETIIAKEGEIREFNKSLFIEKSSLDANNYELQKKLEEMNMEFIKISDYTFLDGQWKFYHEDVFNNVFNSKNEMILYNILISNRKWYKINDKGIKSDEEFGIEDFVYNRNNNQIIFIKVKLNLSESDNKTYFNTHFINILNFINGDSNILVGYENGIRVEYRRMPK